MYHNGERICTASLDGDGHVSVDVSLVEHEDGDGFASVGGFDGVRLEHINWCFRDIRLGDEFRVVVEEVPQADEPTERKTVEEMDRWARSLRPKKRSTDDDLPPLPAPWD